MANWFTRLFKTETPQTQVTPATRVDTSVISIDRSLFGNHSETFPRVNVDELIAKKGTQVYARMRTDEQVKAVVTFKRDAILSRGWTFEFDEDSKLSDTEKARRKRVFEQIIRKLPGSFVDALNVIAVGREYGFSLTEKVYAPVEIDGKQYVGLRGLFGRDPATFNFYTDEHGDLLKCEQMAGGKRIAIELEKFIHYVHNPEFDRWFGRSDLREAYRSWYCKDMFLKFWGLYMEKMAGGLLIAELGTESSIRPNTSAYTDLQNALAQAKASAALIMPQGVALEAIFPGTTDAFEKGCTWMDLSIAKALLVPNLAGVSHTGQTGAYSQAQSQLESFAWTLKADAERLQSCIDEQLFADLGKQNFGDDEYPSFKFKPMSGEQMRWMVDTWIKLVTAGTVIATDVDEGRLREILEMPPREEGDTPLIDPEIATGREHDDGQARKGFEEAEASKDADKERNFRDDKKRATDPVLSKAEQAKVKNKAERPGAKDTPVKHQITKRDAQIALASARERVDFAVIDKKQADMSADLSQQLAITVARATAKELGSDEDLKRLTDEDTSDIGQLQFPAVAVGRLKVTTHKSLADSWALGRQTAQSEIRKTSKKFARGLFEFADLRDKAASYFEATAFKVAGDVSDRARSIMQQELLSSVKNGRSPQQTRTAIWTSLLSKGLSSADAVRSVETDPGVLAALSELGKDDEASAAHYLDTVARTNLFTAMNEARYAEFSDPALGDFVIALRYSAVLDKHTTEICFGLHDHVYETGNPVWDEYRPPNHFNCRSVLIPITAIDMEDGLWDGVESDAPPVEPQEGFGK